MPKFDQYEISDIKGGKDITRAWVGALSQLLRTQDPLLLLKSGGDLSLYEATAQDDQVLACMQQRIASLVSREIEVVPGGEKRADVKAADWLREQIKTLDWDDVAAKMAWGVFYGYSVAECVPVRQGDAVGLSAIKVRNRRRFRFDADLRPRLITPTTWNAGVELEVGRFWHFSVGSDHHDEPYGRGLAWWLYWLCYFKRNDLRFWMTFLETFAKPKPRGKYDSAATAAEQQTLWEALAAYADDTRIMHPMGMEIDLLEPSRSGSADYQAMYGQLDRAIAKVIRSQTMTTEDGSSRAQAQVHQGVADDVDEGDAGLICGSFNRQVVPWLFGLNPQFAGAALPQVWMRRRQEADLKGQAERDKILFDMGFVPSQQYVQDAYGDGFAPPSADQPTPLNGAQLKSIIDLVSQVQQGALQPEVGAELLKLAVPTLTDDLAARIAQPPQGAEEGASQEQGAEVDLGQVAALFAAAKNCTKGLSCGDGCISKTKTCKKPLTPAQAAQHKALIGRVAGTVQKGKGKGKPPVAPPSPPVAPPSPPVAPPSPPVAPPSPPVSKGKKSKSPPNKAEQLRKAIASGNFDKALVIAEKIEAAAKQRAVDAITERPKYYGSYAGGADVLYSDGIEPGNGKIDDWILNELYSQRGYDGLPTVVDEDTLNKEIANGAIEFYRGFGSSRASFEGHFESLKTGAYYAGHGIYGHDTYAAVNKTRRYSGAYGQAAAIKVAKSYGQGVVKAAMAADSKKTNKTNLIDEMNADFNKMRDWATTERDKLADDFFASAEFSDRAATLFRVVFGDSSENTGEKVLTSHIPFSFGNKFLKKYGGGSPSGRYATIKGYDVVELDRAYKGGETFALTLNRSKYLVQETEFK